jgi:hypothetical protein
MRQHPSGRRAIVLASIKTGKVTLTANGHDVDLRIERQLAPLLERSPTSAP